MVAPCEPSVGVGGVLVFVVVVMTVVVLAIVIIMETVKEPVVALIDHGSEINLMSMDFYKKGNGIYTRPQEPRKNYTGLARTSE